LKHPPPSHSKILCDDKFLNPEYEFLTVPLSYSTTDELLYFLWKGFLVVSHNSLFEPLPIL
jgi:hypothetical protein